MLANPKHIFTEATKFRILVVMFKHYTLENNGISMLANTSSGSFQQLLGNIIVYQPDLKCLDESLKSILESFVSNQNSRLFCALADLFEWYRAGMSYNILQLTTKHINSIFKRPPYEERPYTHELTYAQRLIMIYHVLNCEPWETLVNAYDSLYRKMYNRSWPNKSKFLRSEGDGTSVAATSYKIIEECSKTVFTPHLYSVDARVLGLFPPSNVVSKDVIKDGRVSKRRSVSSVGKSKSSKAAKIFAEGKPRSISLVSAGEEQSAACYGLSANSLLPMVPSSSVAPSWIGQQLPVPLAPRSENADCSQAMTMLFAQSTPLSLLGSNQNTQQSFSNPFYSTEILTSALNSQTDFSQTHTQQQPYNSQDMLLPMYHDTVFQQSPLGIFRVSQNMMQAFEFVAPSISRAHSSVASALSLPVQTPESVEISSVTDETLQALSEQLGVPGNGLCCTTTTTTATGSSIAIGSSDGSGYMVQSCVPCSSQNVAVINSSLPIPSASGTADRNEERIQQAPFVSTATQSPDR